MTHGHSFNSFLSKSGDEKRGESPILKHILAELRRSNDFFMIVVLTRYIFKVNSLQIEITIHRTLFGVYFMRIRSLVVVL